MWGISFCTKTVKMASMISMSALPQERSTTFTGTVKVAGMTGRPSTPRQSYPNRIREVREALGKSLKEVANPCGFSGAALQRFETGERQLKVRELEQIAAALGVPPQRLLNSVDPVADQQTQAMLAIFALLPPADRDRLIKIARSLLPDENVARTKAS